MRIAGRQLQGLVTHAGRLVKVTGCFMNFSQLYPQQRIVRFDAQRALDGADGQLWIATGRLPMSLLDECRRRCAQVKLAGRGRGCNERRRCGRRNSVSGELQDWELRFGPTILLPAVQPAARADSRRARGKSRTRPAGFRVHPAPASRSGDADQIPPTSSSCS